MSMHRTRDEWLTIIEEQRRSGLGQTQFCRQHGITCSAFSNAKQRLSPVGVPLSAFVPALPPDADTKTHTAARPDETPSTVPAANHHPAASLSLLLPGATLCLPVDISPRWLATLIREMAP